jgi:hypothetical protein
MTPSGCSGSGVTHRPVARSWPPVCWWQAQSAAAVGANRPETSAALIVYSDPARGLDVSRTNRWVLLTGHYADPKADTCQVTYPGGYDLARDGARIPDAFARRLCEVHFVMTAVRDTTP